MRLGPVKLYVVLAALLLQAFRPTLQEDAAAGTATALFQVTARLVGAAAPQCRGSGDPVSVACGSPASPTLLQPRPDLVGASVQDGWLTYGSRTQAFGNVYAASLTTRVIRYEQWEYVETLVSW